MQPFEVSPHEEKLTWNSLLTQIFSPRNLRASASP
jgi:hypothetical protein